MIRHLLPGVALSVALAVGGPVAAQTNSPTGNQGSYQPHGPDEGFDNMKADTASAKSADELATGAALAKAQNYADAIPHLERAAEKSPRNVTALIYLGFSHRMLAAGMTGDAQNAEFDKALAAYQKGLEIDSRNRLLHEYLGKLHLLRRQYAEAADELATLDALCPSGCDEHTALQQAVTANPPPSKKP